MKNIFKYTFLTLISLTIFSCFNDSDDSVIDGTEIKNFVWKAMNAVYLYKSEIIDLSNERFSNDSEYQSFLNLYESPELLFENLIFNRQTIDRFSFITDNYFELEQQLNGIALSNGAEYNFYLIPGTIDQVFGIVKLVHPNSNASAANLTRGTIFNKINGTPLNTSNLSNLLNQNSYSLNIALYDDNGTDIVSDDQILETSNLISLNKEAYNENPIFKHLIFNLESDKVGYIMYNGFISEFDNQLNQIFGEFKSENIDNLVLDLRYNSGGSIQTATALASMITGQFTGQIFTKLNYNEDLQSNNSNFNFLDQINGNPLNNLNLEKIYILTSYRSASASEMMINSLKSYINVVQIGDKTLGKSQASQLLYDSPNLSRNNVNPNHTYALLPLIAISVNKNDENVPSSGIEPSINVIENPNDYGVIGDFNEPLLNTALMAIQGLNRNSNNFNKESLLIDYHNPKKFTNLMYVD